VRVVEGRADLSRLLVEAGARADAWRELWPLVYGELREIAAARMRNERAGHTLAATALVHEAWMRLAGDDGMTWTSRRHFYGAAARAMQRVLVDHARAVRAEKRGGDRARMSITFDALAHGEADPERTIHVADALDVLEREDPRAAEIARMRWFAGLEVHEVALALDVTERTVLRDWAFARARLSQLLGDESERGA